ncbi:MAG: ABC-type multidrug transport system, ATPase and permease component [Ilumatobacteraceae bacterium]|nr:ABC-type multidrug transport system, ATPase and permease component [Ilumatobacteraceae bacterium]
MYRMMMADPSAKQATLTPGLVRRVWTFAHEYRKRVFGFLGVVVLTAFLGLVPPLMVKAIIDDAVPDKDDAQVVLLAGLMIAVAFAVALIGMVERYLSATIGEGLIYDLRSALFDHVQRQPIAFFTRTQTGALVSRLNNDVIGAQRAVTGTLGTVVSNLVTLALTLGAMFVLSWQLTLLAVVLLPIFVLPAKRVGRRLSGITRQGFDLNASMNATMTERFGVSGALLVKLFGRHEEEAASFSDRAGQVRDIGIQSAMYSRTFMTALTLVGAVGTAVIYLVGGRLVISGSIQVGTLVALGMYVVQIYSPLTSLTNARVDLMTAFVSFDRVFEVLDAPSPITDKPDAVELRSPVGVIDLDHVTFAYPSGAEASVASLESAAQLAAPDIGAGPVLHDLTVHIEQGEMIALVGPSGAGKTTISQLIPRLYDVTSGAVRLDGIDVRDLTQASLRAAIGVVSQDPHLFHESVADNLRYAKPDATDDELVAAARAARIHDVVAALPDGYATVVGERGHRMSGGEKQRLAIARMLLKDPAVVILDEATSNLDSENEAAVQDALAEALRGRTSIVIAHRLSTIVDADRILVLDHGRLIQQGRHIELIDAGGLYAELYRTLVRAEA